MAEHDHAHTSSSSRGRLTIAFGITTTILLAEVVGAILTGSLALLIDAARLFTVSFQSVLTAQDASNVEYVKAVSGFAIGGVSPIGWTRGRVLGAFKRYI
jgi:Co/Zn/Cd efflux system component